MIDNHFNKIDSNNVFTTEAHFIYLPNAYLEKSTFKSKSSLMCPVFKVQPFKLEDRPPLVTDFEILIMEKIVNQAPKAELPLKLDSEVGLMYDYSTYNIQCHILNMYWMVFAFRYNNLGFQGSLPKSFRGKLMTILYFITT
jgi:hypothetical protein